mmetsp:Transcript_34686/g.81899  ORF Transcript_34686/g.81899 Transcript_34686/m.81899 type:complete len:501 (+) Transcript_34686:163-1665(+)
MEARTARTLLAELKVLRSPARLFNRLDVGRDRELLAVVEVRAVVGQDEADVVEVGALLDLLLVDLLELVGLAVVGAEDLLKGAPRDVLLGATEGRLGAADVLALLHAHDGREPDRRGEDVAVRVPLLLVDVAPAVELGLAEEARHREGAAVNDAGDEHNVEQGADRLDAVLLGRPCAALVDVLAKLLLRGGHLLRFRLEGRSGGDCARSAKVGVLEELREQAGALEVLPGALEPGLEELRGRGARPPGLDVRLHDGQACIAAAEAVGAREKSFPAESDENFRHRAVLCVNVRVVVDGPLVEPGVVLRRVLERVREHIVEDVDRAVQGLGDVEEIVERRAREVLQRGGAALVGLVLRRVLDLHAVLKDIVAIDLQATLGLDRELEVHLGPRPTHRAQDLYVVRRVRGHRVKVDNLKAASGPGREGRSVEGVGLEDDAELSGEVVAPEEVVVIRHGGQAGHGCRILLIESGPHELLELVQAVRVRLEEALVHDSLHEDASAT